MISNAKIIVNRCGREGCGIVAVLVARRQLPAWIREYAGNAPCERQDEHDMSEWTRRTITRDVLILRALWTVGRAITPRLPSDPTAHVLADSIGWELGEPAEHESLPSWMRADHVEVSWATVVLAARVAGMVRDDWPTDDRLHHRWGRVARYLNMWSHRVY